MIPYIIGIGGDKSAFGGFCIDGGSGSRSSFDELNAPLIRVGTFPSNLGVGGISNLKLSLWLILLSKATVDLRDSDQGPRIGLFAGIRLRPSGGYGSHDFQSDGPSCACGGALVNSGYRF